ncbi:MAG TPA: hypothetical protein VFI42_18835 [Thermomicrobiaceae bacterium]|nr:hypothetical protein [Thermomicrobiaceae bacterium]
MDENEQRIAAALAWIVSALERHQVPHQLVGGLAARAHGATRELVDIDFYAPLDKATTLLDEIRPYITWGPRHHRSSSWDLVFVKIDYNGQRIEIGDTSSRPKFFSRRDGCWLDQRIDYDRATAIPILGVVVPVMPKDELIDYKSALQRDVDWIDIEQLSG